MKTDLAEFAKEMIDFGRKLERGYFDPVTLNVDSEKAEYPENANITSSLLRVYDTDDIECWQEKVADLEMSLSESRNQIDYWETKYIRAISESEYLINAIVNIYANGAETHKKAFLEYLIKSYQKLYPKHSHREVIEVFQDL